MNRQQHRQAGRQTSKETGRHTDKLTDRPVYIQRDKTYRQIGCIHAYGQAGRQTYEQQYLDVSTRKTRSSSHCSQRYLDKAEL